MSEAEIAAITKYDLYYESRMTKMEVIGEELKNDVKEIKSDLRWMLGVWISINTIMLGLMVHGFKLF
jgi:hypothetical protein